MSSGKTYMGVPRELIPWFPSIDYGKCTKCMKCVDFCKKRGYNVFEIDSESGFPKVVNPYNCQVGCRSCRQICPENAISFPPLRETMNLINMVRYRKLR